MQATTVAKILIVDDERSMRDMLAHVLKTAGYSVSRAESAQSATEQMKADIFDLVISDVRMPGMDGIGLLETVRNCSPPTAVILMSAYASLETARKAFKMGADDFVQKPFDVDELKVIVSHVLEKVTLRQENELLRKQFHERYGLGSLVGRSPKMTQVYELVETVAATSSTILIHGESGTGKELVARAIHEQSPRRTAPFVSINCGAFTETLLESELFGYVKGAFTGAFANKKGLCESAEGGTLFLDEISEMSPVMQVKLLRVLQERRIRRVGGTEEIPIDVRIVGATNRDLTAMMEEGKFREDLYYRINVIAIDLPPLRERQEDVRELVFHFIEKHASAAGKAGLGITEEALMLLERYDYPGNVRQLEHIIERAIALEPTTSIQPSRLTEQVLGYNPRQLESAAMLPQEGIDLTAYLEEVEKTFLRLALERTGGSQTKAAELLGMSVRSFRHCLDKFEMRTSSARPREGAPGDEQPSPPC